MNRFKKMLAVLVAVTMIGGGMSMVANAEEKLIAPVQEKEVVAEFVQQMGALNVDAITAEQLQTVLTNSSGNYYHHYDSLCSEIDEEFPYLKTFTGEHIAFVTRVTGIGSGLTVGTNRYVDFYVNENIVGEITKNNFSSGVVTVKSVPKSGGSAACRLYRIYFDVTAEIPNGAVLFTFNFPDAVVYNNANIPCEYTLHENTSQYSTNPSFVLNAQSGVAQTSVYKCHYARGDVNHDGVVDSNDSQLILSSLVGLVTLEENRTALDEISFQQAADFNQDGSVNLVDVLSINQS
ncbi:MAG TPA: hypothetical protein DCO72_04050 [Ruminococcus sp.]|nr:hypothetical protein [Ruminococcus sp.]